MKEKVIKIIAEVAEVPIESLNVNTNLINDLDLESLDLVELVGAFEEAFKVEIPDKDIKKIQTVGDIIEFIESHV